MNKRAALSHGRSGKARIYIIMPAFSSFSDAGHIEARAPFHAGEARLFRVFFYAILRTNFKQAVRTARRRKGMYPCGKAYIARST